MDLKPELINVMGRSTEVISKVIQDAGFGVKATFTPYDSGLSDAIGAFRVEVVLFPEPVGGGDEDTGVETDG